VNITYPCTGSPHSRVGQVPLLAIVAESSVTLAVKLAANALPTGAMPSMWGSSPVDHWRADRIGAGLAWARSRGRVQSSCAAYPLADCGAITGVCVGHRATWSVVASPAASPWLGAERREVREIRFRRLRSARQCLL
jgi:hypothetical protein